MKKLFWGLCLSLLFSATAYAQGRGNWANATPEEIADRQTAMMKDSLNLSAEQVEKVKVINLKYAQKMKKTFEEAGDDRMTAMMEIRTQRENQDYEIKKVLDKEQRTKYTAMRARQAQRMTREGRGQRERE